MEALFRAGGFGIAEENESEHHVDGRTSAKKRYTYRFSHPPDLRHQPVRQLALPTLPEMLLRCAICISSRHPERIGARTPSAADARTKASALALARGRLIGPPSWS